MNGFLKVLSSKTQFYVLNYSDLEDLTYKSHGQMAFKLFTLQCSENKTVTRFGRDCFIVLLKKQELLLVVHFFVFHIRHIVTVG